MILNSANLATLYLGFKTTFNEGLGQAESQYEQIVTPVPSGTREEKYGWLGKVPGFRKWLGDRVINSIMVHDYAIKNEPYENTIGVEKEDIDDDQYGVYAPLFREMGYATKAHPNELAFTLLKNGFAALAYDGQNFFDTDHPVLGVNGNPLSVANTDGGAGTPWFLLALNRPIRAIIWQTRKPYNFVAMDKMDDENVFMRKQLRYGVDARVAAGFGLWQTAWGSKQTLDADNYKAARAALLGMKGDYGRPLGIVPTHLLVPPSLEGEAMEILNSERNAAGATNIWRNTAKSMVVPWLA